MISPDEEHSRRVQRLERKEQRDYIQLVGPAVDPVPVEDVRHALDVAATMRWEAVVRE